MSDRINVHGLQVEPVLYDFINNEALPGSGVDQEAFWSGAAEVINDLAPRNRELLAIRDDLQAKIDQWHRDHPGAIDFPAYKAFLIEIGYLVDVPEDFQISTTGVDSEIAETAGPQLVVPILNARFALNAANARWGSLYDALYGTDVIPETDGAEKVGAYNKVRGDKVIAYAKNFLDQAVPLESGSYADVTGLAVVDGALHFWTDVEEYFQSTLELIAALPPNPHGKLHGPLPVPESPAEHDLDFRTHFERRMRLHELPVYRSEFVKVTP